MSILSWLLVTLAGLSLAAMVVSLTIANRAAREARSTIFPIVREEEAVRARRARIATSLTGVIAAIMAGAFFVSGQLPPAAILPQQAPPEVVAVAESPVAETEPPPSSTEAPLPPTEEQEVPTNNQVVLVTEQQPTGETPSPPATPTPLPPMPTPTLALPATPTSVPPSPTPADTPVPAPVSVQIGPIAFTTQVTDRREPISPTTVFSDTVSRVYASFPYNGMRNGLNWTQVWYFNGIEFSRGEQSWKWGSTDRSYVFTKLVGAGEYRLELYVNDDLLTTGEFTVRGPVAIGGPGIRESPGTRESLETGGTPENPEPTGTSGAPESLGTPESPGTWESPGSTENPASP